MSFLITGGSGFVGRYVKRTPFLSNQTCYFPTHSEFDLTDLETMRTYLKGKNITNVIHLAGAVGVNDYARLYEANVSGLYRLMLACVESGIRHFTFASGNTVYDSTLNIAHKVDEPCSPNPGNQYALSKYVGETMVADFFGSRSIPYANVRISDIYGPNQKTGNLMKAIVKNAAAYQPLALYGKGLRTRDYIYVSDVADGLAFISKEGMHGTINLGTGIGTSVAQLVDIASTAIDETLPITHVDVEVEDTSTIWLDVSELENMGFSPSVPLREGIKNCIKEYGENYDN